MNIKNIITRTKRKMVREVKYAIWSIKVTFSQHDFIRFKLIDGSLLDYPLRTSIAKMLFLGNFENSEIAFVRNSLKSGDIFLDIGANAGIYTMIASRLVGATGHVYSFEPSKRELKLLKHNIAIKNLKNVTVIESAVSNHSGTAKLAVAKDGGLNSFADTSRQDQQIESWEIVDTISLDDFVQKYSVPKVDFIKIDVEGAEKLVFDGAMRMLKSEHPKTILFEASDFNSSGFGYTAKSLLSYFLDQGLRLFVLNNKGIAHQISGYDSKYGNEIYNFVIKNHNPEGIFLD